MSGEVETLRAEILGLESIVERQAEEIRSLVEEIGALKREVSLEESRAYAQEEENSRLTDEIAYLKRRYCEISADLAKSLKGSAEKASDLARMSS